MDAKVVKAQTQCAPADSAAAAARTPPPPLPLPPGVTVQSLPSRLRPTGRLLFTSAPKSVAGNTKTSQRNVSRATIQPHAEDLDEQGLVAESSGQIFTTGPVPLAAQTDILPAPVEKNSVSLISEIDVSTSTLVTPQSCEEVSTATFLEENLLANHASESNNAQLSKTEHVLSNASGAIPSLESDLTISMCVQDIPHGTGSLLEEDAPVMLATGAGAFQEAGLTTVLEESTPLVIRDSEIIAKELSKTEDVLDCATDNRPLLESLPASVKTVGDVPCESGVVAHLSSEGTHRLHDTNLTNSKSSEDTTNNANASSYSPGSFSRQVAAHLTLEPVFLPTGELPITLPVRKPALSELSLLAAPNVKDSVHLWEEHSDEIISQRVTSLLSDFSSFEAECDLLFTICTSSHHLEIREDLMGTSETTESDQTINSQMLHQITQAQIDQFGCRTPDVLERIGHVFTAALAGLEGKGMTILELRSFMAALLTQVQRDLEQRTASHVEPDSDITENETSSGLLQAILDTLSSPFST